MRNIKKVVCKKPYIYDGLNIQVGDTVELVDLGEIYELAESNGHVLTKEPDSKGLSYKTWFDDFEENKEVKTILYVAVNKESGKVMSGAKGQYAFGDKATLGRSVGQKYRGAKGSYTIREIELVTAPEEVE